MVDSVMTRRRAFMLLATGAGLVAQPGCSPASVIKVVKSLKWDKIIKVVVNVLKGVAIFIGIVDGKEVQAEMDLTDGQVREAQKGDLFQVELNDGSQKMIKPEIENK